MLTSISRTRMKSLIYPTFSAFAPTFSKPTPLFLFSLPFPFPSPFLSNSRPPTTLCFSHTHQPPPLPSIYSSLISSTHTQARIFATQPSHSSSGEIHVIVGPMFAGKTTTLLHRIRAESSNGRSVAIIKSNKDSRYGLDSIVTHDGEKLACWALPNLSSFKLKVGPDAYDKLEVIGIDEAQFFEDLYDFCSKVADDDGKTVIVAGLDGDYLRRRFGSVLDIIPIADSVTKLSARCEVCGKSAFFTQRKTEETEREVIGGADVYMPVCRKHYNASTGQVVVKAAGTTTHKVVMQCGGSIL